VELAELIGLRPEPCAGLLVTLTRRCPLSCAHCSTSSTMDSKEEPGSARLLGFFRSFRPDDRPDVTLLTGGEPLLLPGLARELALAAHDAGSRVALLSGMFFARGPRIPRPIMRAITTADHFSASLDAHHEREVPRADVFRAIRTILDAGVPSSLHLVGSGPDDPYLADITTAVRRTFGDTVPMLVNEVRSVGRAADWLRATQPGAGDPRGLPCTMAAWPVVAFDGRVIACCNQRTVDTRPVPAHLRLGHIADDDWAAVRRRSLDSPELRLIRAIGPTRLRARYGDVEPRGGYCGGCRTLGQHRETVAGAERDASGPVGLLLDQLTAQQQRADGPVALLRRYGCAPYAHLVAPGQSAGPSTTATGGTR